MDSVTYTPFIQDCDSIFDRTMNNCLKNTYSDNKIPPDEIKKHPLPTNSFIQGVIFHLFIAESF